MSPIVRVIIIALMAGTLGTTVGGILGIIVKKPPKAYIACMLAFAAGAMLGMSIFEMLPEAFGVGGGSIVAIGLAIGAATILLYTACKGKSQNSGEIQTVNLNDTSQSRRLLSVGFMVFLAVILHDLPEGLAIGAGERVGIGMTLGMAMLLHNVPEGLAIAVPLKAGGVGTRRILGLTFLAGVPTVLGAVAGYYLGVNNYLAALMLAFASGIMLFVVFLEILPTAYSCSKKYYLTTVCLILGVLIIVIVSRLMH